MKTQQGRLSQSETLSLLPVVAFVWLTRTTLFDRLVPLSKLCVKFLDVCTIVQKVFGNIFIFLALVWNGGGIHV